MAAPPLAGAIADQVGSVRIVFILGGAIVVVSMLALGLFRRINTVAQVIDWSSSPVCIAINGVDMVGFIVVAIRPKATMYRVLNSDLLT